MSENDPPFISIDDLLARHRTGAKWSDLTDDERHAFMGYVADQVEQADDWVNPVTGHGGDCGCISCHMSQNQ